MNFLRSIRTDLVDKRLLPVVVVLAALAILIPVGSGLLSGSGSTKPAALPAPLPTPPPGTPSPAAALLAVAGPGIPATKRYTGRELDPFRARAGAAATTPAATAGPVAVKVNTTPVSPVSPGGAAKPVKPVKPATPTTQVKTPTPTTKVAPPATPRPAPKTSTSAPQAELAKLGRRETYRVDASIVDATGVRSIGGLGRLSPLPSVSNPLVEYLGVLKNRRAVAFLVNPGAVPKGPGACVPRTGACQLLVLKPGQVEALGIRTTSGSVLQASIAVSGWSVVRHSSVAAALKVRAQEVPQGRTLVMHAAQPVLSNVVYSVAQGAVALVPAVVNSLTNAVTKLLGG